MLQKSPSGSLCPYYYMGGELHPLHYGGFHDNKKCLFEIIKAEEVFILKSPGNNNRRIWIDLYETHLDDEVVVFLLEHLINIQHKINKFCFVGCSSENKRKIQMKMKKQNLDLLKQTQYFSDPEDAKRWLIGKLN